MDVRIGLWRRQTAEELMLLNCGVGEDSWESLGLQGDQPWDFFGRNDAKAEAPVLWPPHAKSWLTGKDSDAGKDWRQEEQGTTEDEMAGWHHWFDGCESEWTPGVGDGQGGLACCDSWGHKESDTTERLNWTELNWRATLSHRYFKRPFRWDVVRELEKWINSKKNFVFWQNQYSLFKYLQSVVFVTAAQAS